MTGKILLQVIVGMTCENISIWPLLLYWYFRQCCFHVYPSGAYLLFTVVGGSGVAFQIRDRCLGQSISQESGKLSLGSTTKFKQRYDLRSIN